MKVTITINGKSIETTGDKTILECASDVGIEIPTMCHLKNRVSQGGCMICTVLETGNGEFIPACSTLVQDSMKIDTESEAVQLKRKQVLQLLLSEHRGDCNAPCQRACPAGYDTAHAVRLLRQGKAVEAARFTLETLPLAAILGEICPAPCTRTCRRGMVDQPVAIRQLHGVLAQQAGLPAPGVNSSTAKSLGIVGTGPAGLAAAWQASMAGWQVIMYEKEEQAAPTLHRAFSEAGADPAVIDATILQLQEQGVAIKTSSQVTTGDQLNTIREKHDATIVAWGLEGAPETAGESEPCESGIYTIGNARRPVKMAVTAVGQAINAVREITGSARDKRQFISVSKDFTAHEANALASHNDKLCEHVKPDTEWASGIDHHRCLVCDCTAKNDCTLRDLSTEYSVKQFHYPTLVRDGAGRTGHSIVYEDGKCIRCGICVDISNRLENSAGLTLKNRGLSITVGPPADSDFNEILDALPAECIHACPTGALTFGIQECR
jgi:ferredoxin